MLTAKHSNMIIKKQLPSKYTGSDKESKTDAYFREICQEYSLKRNSFNPNKNNASPNIFINKLKTRYESYFIE
jgi:hypothetical protein